MEFTGQLTIFTASEAQWAQDATLLFARLPDLAQKILDARIEFAKSADPSYEDPGVTTRFAKTDFLARVRLGEASKRLHEVSLQHGRTAEGEEKHVVSVPMTKNEKRGLLALAQRDNTNARKYLELPELRAVEEEAITDEFALFVAASDIMSEDETAAFSNLLRDPALSEANAQQEREDAERALAATASIITALETNLEQ